MNEIKDLVVVIPGILGSRLVHTSGGRTRTLWDLGLRSLPTTLRLLLKGNFVAPDPDDGVQPDGLITEPAWLPDFFGVDGYTEMIKTLQERLGDQLRTFAYDWRYSNAHTAQLFSDCVLPELSRWHAGPGSAQSRLVLVCHSMGGLVARYFCEHLGGAEHTRRIITFGTPHRGALKALYALSGVMKIGHVIDASTIVGEWPSVWEMLPQYPCVRRPDGSFVHLQDSGLTLVASPRFAAARTFQSAIRMPAEARAKAGDDDPYDQLVFFGRVQTTAQYAKQVADGLAVIKPGADGVSDRGGDGTVPSFASMPIEWNRTAAALPLLDKHAALATRQSALEHLLNRLDPDDVSLDKRRQPQMADDVLDELRPDVVDQHAAQAVGGDIDGPALALDVPAVVESGERAVVEVVAPLTGEVALSVEDHERRYTWRLVAENTGIEEARGNVLRADLGSLPDGTYTVSTVTTHPVSDHVLVWSGEPDQVRE
jgi:pimeloyl-ACP methyl ester carboxylesterase